MTYYPVLYSGYYHGVVSQRRIDHFVCAAVVQSWIDRFVYAAVVQSWIDYSVYAHVVGHAETACRMIGCFAVGPVVADYHYETWMVIYCFDETPAGQGVDQMRVVDYFVDSGGG